MAKADAEPRGPEVHIEQAIGRLYRFLAGNRWTRFPWAVVQTFSKAEGALLSGSMAYYTFLSLLPLLMVAAFVIATFASPGPDARETVAEALNQVFPGIGREVFDGVINQVVANRAALGLFGLLSVAYAGSGFVGSMTACLNRMWRQLAINGIKADPAWKGGGYSSQPTPKRSPPCRRPSRRPPRRDIPGRPVGEGRQHIAEGADERIALANDLIDA